MIPKKLPNTQCPILLGCANANTDIGRPLATCCTARVRRGQ